MDTNTTLLGNSQTFFGVLATLVILCIFHDGNNFIYRALKEIFVSLRTKISELEKELNGIAKRIDDNKEIKEFKQFIKNKGTDFYHIDMQLLSEGTTLLDNVELAQMEIFSQLGESKFLVRFWRKFSPRNSESLLCSLYAFLYCLVVFALDEIGNSPVVISFLWIFTALSFSFLSSIWYHYWIRTNPKFFTRGTLLELYEKSILQIASKYFKYLLLVIVFFVILLISSYRLNATTCGYIFLVFLFVSALLFGSREIRLFTMEPIRYTKLFLIFHFIYLLCFSWLLVGILYGVDELMGRLPGLFVNDFHSFYIKDGLKITVFVFVLLNGVILPFSIPYYRLKKIYTDLVKTGDKLKKEAEKKEKELIRDFNAFYGKTMKDMLSKHSSPK